MNNSIPPNRDRQMLSHDRCLANTLISRKIATKTAARKIFASMHITRPLMPAAPRSKESPATLPPTTPPMALADAGIKLYAGVQGQADAAAKALADGSLVSVKSEGGLK